jgi:hypothetical protein
MMIAGMLDLFNNLVDSLDNYVLFFGYKYCCHLKAMNNSDIAKMLEISQVETDI